MRRLHRGAGLVALLLPILISACADDSTKPDFVEEVVLFGYLYVGETVSDTNAIRLERTRPVDQYYDASQAAIANAIVTLRADSATVEDTLGMTTPGNYANPGVLIRESTSYHLKAVIDGQTITATTTTPRVFEAVREPRVITEGDMIQSTIADSFPIVIACSEPEQIFLVDVYCLEDWQTARYVHRLGGADDTPQSYEEYGGDNDEPRHIQAYFRLREIQESDQGYVVSFYGDMMWFFGRYTVGVFSLDENYYNYLYRDHPERNGGVIGGVGVFGSACRKQCDVRVVE